MESSRARGPAPVWDVPLPAARTRNYDQLYVVNNVGEDVVIVSSRAETVCTHFHRGRSHFCSQTEERPCELDHRETGPPRFGAWVAICYPGKRKTLLLRLTEVACRHEPALLHREHSLRARLLHVWREGNNEYCEMYAQLGDHQAGVYVPPEPDVRSIVLHMIGADDRHDDQGKQRRGPFRKKLEAWQRKQNTIERVNATKNGGAQ